MVDHTGGSSQRSSHHLPHHSHFQAHHRHHYHQDIHGPLSAGVVEGGHRPFATFHSSPLQHPLHPSSSSSSNSASSIAPIAAPPSAPSTRGNLSVTDILERYQDASKEFLVSILNAKAKEDERKAAEERYRIEQVKLQAKQLELEMLVEKRRGSPPAGMASVSMVVPAKLWARSYPAQSSESSGHYVSSGSYYGNGYSHYSEASRSHSSNNNGASHNGSSSKHSHHDHIPHGSQDDSQNSPYPQDHSMQPSPQSRPPFLKINTSVRQYHSQPQSAQRLPPSPHSTLPPLPSTNPPKGIGRHYNLPSLNASAQSSPVATVDYQSHIPPPLTPKDEHVSPTSALSPTQYSNMKRKSVIHDAVMDAVRAKVLRNAAGQQQQQQQHQQHQQHKRAAIEMERERERERDRDTRRKMHHERSPETSKKAQDSSAASNAEGKHDDRQDERLEGPLLSSLPAGASSPPSPTSGAAENGRNGRSRSRSRSISPPPPPVQASSKSRHPMSKSQLSQSVEAQRESSPSMETDRRRGQDMESEGN
ncbi:hypothetical protein BGX34_008419 [Mortierella sp. NVP85]|nr:hypothetical protein BGX34_008419 [Mortierella sp. NVP85]